MYIPAVSSQTLLYIKGRSSGRTTGIRGQVVGRLECCFYTRTLEHVFSVVGKFHPLQNERENKVKLSGRRLSF
jgi:hypothetical protein